MTANIIDAIVHLVENPVTHLVNYYQGKNRANNLGDALEEYVKDLFANSFDMDEKDRLRKIQETFSYLGNNSNPPDAMLCDGDAIEVKKIETPNAALALNSSYPKHKLYSDSEMISNACRDAEEWKEKDIIYTVGVVKDNELKHLCMVYGMDYCASEKCYSRIKYRIKEGVESIHGVEFAETHELGRVNRVDPLGITYLRVRGMWGIENPWSVFNYVYSRNTQKNFTFMCIINENKWDEFDNTDLLIEMAYSNKALNIQYIEIKNPDNPAQLQDARLITYEI